VQLFTDIVWGMFGSPAYTTPNPSREEIEAAMILTAVRSDALDFFEFVDLHRNLRLMRSNPAQVILLRQASSPKGNSDISSPIKEQNDIAILSMSALDKSPKRVLSVERVSPVERSSSFQMRLEKEREQEIQRAERMQSEKAMSEENQAALNHSQILKRRNRMTSKVSTRLLEAILRNPVTTNISASAQSKRFSSRSGSFNTDLPITQERTSRDVQELTKFFRKSVHLCDMSKETMLALAQCCTALFIPSKSTIFNLKDWGSGFLIIIVGVANVLVRGPDGNALKMCNLRAGQCFGEMFLLFGEHLPRRFKVEAAAEGVLAAFVEREQYFAIGLDAYHRGKTWADLSKKHSLLLQMPSLNHLDPTEKFHLCYQLSEKTFPARAELYNSTTDAVDAPKADQLFRDSSVLQEKPNKPLMIVQSGTCDVFVDAPKEEKKPTSHERDLNYHAHFQMHGAKPKLFRVSSLAAGAIFGSFSTGPRVRKIVASDVSSVQAPALFFAS
jgi:CRP-like cAMP-binding protein